MNKRVVPKVSGLVKVGSLTAAPEADVAALPDFESGAGSAAKTTPRLFEASQSPTPVISEQPIKDEHSPIAVTRPSAPSPAPG